MADDDDLGLRYLERMREPLILTPEDEEMLAKLLEKDEGDG